MSSTQTGFCGRLVTAMKENPVAAALIGSGAFWLLAGDQKLKSGTRATTAAASPMANIDTRNLRSAASGVQRTAAPATAPELDHEGAFNISETFRDAGSAASDAVSDMAERTKERFYEGVAYARENVGQPGKEAFANAQSSVADLFERQPLILGVVGLAVGAAIARSFRTSDLENEWMGGVSDDVRSEQRPQSGIAKTYAKRPIS